MELGSLTFRKPKFVLVMSRMFTFLEFVVIIRSQTVSGMVYFVCPTSHNPYAPVFSVPSPVTLPALQIVTLTIRPGYRVFIRDTTGPLSAVVFPHESIITSFHAFASGVTDAC